MAYKFRKKEVEEMKQLIIGSCKSSEYYAGLYSAIAIRNGLELTAMTSPYKRKKQKAERDLALYEKLTLDDKPNW